MGWKRGDPDADTDLERQLADGEGHTQRSVQPLGEERGLVRTAGTENREFVAAEPRERLAGSYLFVQSGCDGLQQRIPGLVPERVVDLLEVVDAEEQHRDGAVLAPRAQDRLSDAVAEQVPVWQVGELVVQGAMLDLLQLPPQTHGNAPQ